METPRPPRDGWRPPEEDGVALEHYFTHEDCQVLFCCESCGRGRHVPLETVIARLKELGVGDEKTGVRAVARFVIKPCQKCGSREITTRPGFQASRAAR